MADSSTAAGKRSMATVQEATTSGSLLATSGPYTERIFTVGDLMGRTEASLMSVRNFGKTSLEEIKAKLVELGLSLS